MLIKNAEICTMEGPRIPCGFVLCEGTRIAAVGKMEDCPDSCGEALDAKGKLLLPGFVDAHTHLGIWEDSLGWEGEDGNEEDDPSTPHLRGQDGVNPMDRSFADAVAAGITTAVIGPGSGNCISGQMIAVKTVGRCIDRMILRAPLAIKCALGENPKWVYGKKGKGPYTRLGSAAIIREQFYRARRYGEDLEAAVRNATPRPSYDMKSEALLPALRREIAVHIHAHRADDIFTAIRIIKEFNLRGVIIHGTWSHLIAEELKEEKIPIVLGPIINTRSKQELREQELFTAAILSKNEIPFAICSDYPAMGEEYLPLSAGLAVRGGLAYEEALKALTIYPARIVGLDHRVGSIAPGKDADLCLFGADPLSVCGGPLWVMVNGRIIRQ